ncbi:MAG TPA: ABC transporter permease [Terriglobales bacterium]|nr:ABC transporter permease [Terriglobales bacterium]
MAAFSSLGTAWHDARYGVRLLRRNPGFTAVAVLTIALGIGANTAIFTLFDALLLESLPVREPSQLVLFSDASDEGTYTNTSPLTGQWGRFTRESYEFLKSQPLPFESLCAFRNGTATVSVRMPGQSKDAQVRRAVAHLVSGNYFATMGVDAEFGRTFSDEDNRTSAPPVAVVSNGYWKQVLNSDPSAVGKVVILNGLSVTIIGIAPAEFFGERVRQAPDFWLPFVFQPQIELRESYLERTDTYWLGLMGRLWHGTAREQARVAATIALQQYLTSQAGTELTAERKQGIERTYIRLYDGGAGISGLRLEYSRPLHVLLAVVAMVLLIACANVGNLLITRAAARRTEISVRLTLGARRGRLLRQLLTEGLLLATLGAGAGLLIGYWGTHGLVALTNLGSSPIEPRLNPLVLTFTLGITLFTGVLCGLAPALQARKTDLVTALKAGGRGATNQEKFAIKHGLILAQITISLVLLVGAILFSRSLLNLEHEPLGFDPNNVLIASINPRIAGYKPTEVAALYRKLFDRLNGLPGVQVATIARFSPLSGHVSASNVHAVEGYSARPHESMSVSDVLVGPDYPRTLGIPLLLGREINLRDTEGSATVAMVNEAFVRHYFPAESPIGHRFRYGDQSYAIVGVLKNVQFEDAKTKARDMIFRALLQDQTQTAMTAELEVRTIGDPGAMASQVRKAVSEEDSQIPVSGVQSLRDQVQESFSEERLAAQLVSLFGGMALFLACIGLYGVTAQGVARRTNEIGVRMALGAEGRDILGMILRETCLLLGGGLLLGLPLSYAASRAISSQLFGLGPGDIFSFLVAVAALAIVMALAGFLPARRATRVDPVVALHYE